MLNSARGFFRGLSRWIRDCTNQLAELGLRLQICIIDDGPIDETAVAARRAGANERRDMAALRAKLLADSPGQFAHTHVREEFSAQKMICACPVVSTSPNMSWLTQIGEPPPLAVRRAEVRPW